MQSAGFHKLGVWALGVGAVVVPLLMMPTGYQVASTPKLLGIACVVFVLGGAALWLGKCVDRASFALPWLVYLGIVAVQTGRSLNVDAGGAFLILQLCGGLVGIGVALFVDRSLWVLRCVAVGGVVVSVIGVLEYWGLIALPSAGRPSATLGFRNIAGMYLAVALFLSGALLFEKDKNDRWLGTTAVTLMAVFLIFTRTRGAWLGVGVAGFAGCFLAWRYSVLQMIWDRILSSKKVFAGMALVVVLSAWMPSHFEDRSASRLDENKTTVTQSVASLIQPGGDRGRFKIWRHTLEMIADAPILGVGVNNWAVYYPKYDMGDALGIVVAPKRPHNDFLWIWSELGLVGLGAYLWLLLCIGRQLLRRIRMEDATVLPAVFAGLGALALLVHSCFSFPCEQPVAVFFFALALGLAGQSEGTRIFRPHRLVRGYGGLCLLAGIAAWWVGLRIVQFDTHFANALQAKDQEQFERQVKEAKKARLAGIFDHRVFLMEGLGYTALKQYSEAVDTYKRYRQFQPYLPALHNNLGRALEGLGDYAEAEAAYLKGLETFSDRSGLMVSNLAAVYKKQGQEEKALHLYESAAKLSAEGYHNLGVIYAERGVWEKALHAYQKALSLSPDMAIVYYSMGGVKLLKGDYVAAAADYETFLNAWQGVQDYVRDAQKRLRQIYPVLGDRYIRTQQFEDAARVYWRLVELGDVSPELLNNLILIYGRLGQFDEAVRAGHMALYYHPKFYQAYLSLATVYEDWGNVEQALANYRAFLNHWPTDDDLAKRAQSRIDLLQKQ